MKESKSTQWINTVLSRIYMLPPNVGKHIVEKCGRKCASSGDLIVKAKRVYSECKDPGDLENLFNTFKNEAYKDGILYKEDDVIYLEFEKCSCDLVKAGVDNPFMCNCTIGYTREIFEALFRKPIKVTLMKSILKGDEICKQAIYVDVINFVPFSF